MRPGEVPAENGACWICGARESAHWKDRTQTKELTPADLRITDARYGQTLALRRCEECGFVFAADFNSGDLERLYSQMSDQQYLETLEPRSRQFRGLLKTVKRLHPTASTLMDIGAGAGLMVAEAQAVGLTAVGVEPSKALVAHAAAQGRAGILEGTYPHPRLEGRRFDLVTLVDVIEHVANPLQLLRSARSALAPGGLVLVVTPDIGSLTARLLGDRWWHYRLAHIGYFNATSLAKMASLSQLELVYRTRPKWYFRAGYIMHRLATYLPLDWLNRRVERSPYLSRIYDTILPINPFDSLLAVYRQSD